MIRPRKFYERKVWPATRLFEDPAYLAYKEERKRLGLVPVEEVSPRPKMILVQAELLFSTEPGEVMPTRKEFQAVLLAALQEHNINSNLKCLDVVVNATPRKPRRG